MIYILLLKGLKEKKIKIKMLENILKYNFQHEIMYEIQRKVKKLDHVFYLKRILIIYKIFQNNDFIS